MNAAHRLGRACLLGLCCFVIYLTNFRPLVSQDSIPARLLPFSVLREGNVDFDEFGWLVRLYRAPYFLHEARDGHLLSSYAIATPLLVTPLSLPAVWWLRAHQIEDDDVRFRVVTLIMERVGAAAIAAVSVALVYLALIHVTAARCAFWVALVYGLGTNIWVVGSQSLLQHGAAAMALAGMSVFLMGADTRWRAVVAGAFTTLAVLARPTMVTFALLAVVFVWRERRGSLLAFLCVPFAGAVWLQTYNARLAGVVQGGYHDVAFTAPRLGRLMGLLVSPNRGLLVYTPVTVLAGLGVWRKDVGTPRWVRYLQIGIAGYLLLYSAWKGWWGGNTYGPRFLTDVLPALALCAAPSIERLWRSRSGRIVVASLVAWGFAVQLVGVYCDTNTWNMVTKLGLGPRQRIWDVIDSQILRAARAGWNGTQMIPLLRQTLTDPRPALLRPMAAQDLAGEITVEDPLPLRYRRAENADLTIRLTNRGRMVWPAFSDFGWLHCRLNYRWSLNGTLLNETGAIELGRNLGPDESMVVRGRVEAPALPGAYELELMLIQTLKPDRGTFGGAVLRVPARIE